jgi:hypothetical protein
LLLTILTEPVEEGKKRRIAEYTDIGAQEMNEHPKFIIASLRSELEKERTSHTRTHEQAEKEIRSLRAQLARREAELEACVVHCDPSALPRSVAHGEGLPGGRLQEHGEPNHVGISPSLTPEEAVEILGLRVVRQKELELEVKLLSSKV